MRQTDKKKRSFKKKLLDPCKKEPSRFWEHFKYCMSISSIHGLKHVVWSKRSRWERLLWIGIILGSLIFGVLKGHEVFLHFLYRPTVVTVELDYREWNNEFPTMTFCQREFDEKTFVKTLRAMNMTYDDKTVEYLEDLAFKTYYDYHSYEKYANGSATEYLKPEEYLDVLLKIVPSVSVDKDATLKELKGKNVFPYDSIRPISPLITEYGICSTLNPNVGMYYTPKYFNRSVGESWRPITYTYLDERVHFETRKIVTSYIVAAHSTHEIIDILTRFSPAEKVTRHFLRVVSTSVHTSDYASSLTIQQRNCRNVHEAEILDHSPVYSYNLCRIECRIRLAMKYCKCLPYYYRRNGEKICNMTGMYCLSKHLDELLYLEINNKSICECLQGCNTDLVSVQEIDSRGWLLDTSLGIEIYEIPRIRYLRKSVFTKTDVLVQVGGILGLCLGSSILSVIEIIYFMTLRFYWGVIKEKSIESSL